MRFHPTRSLLPLLLLLLAACSQITPRPVAEVAQQAEPTVVYEQTGAAGGSYPCTSTTHSVADDFIVPEGQSFTFDALQLFGIDGTATEFTLKLYSDNAGQPGTLLHTFTQPTFTVSDKVYSIDVPQTTLTTGTYWLDILSGPDWFECWTLSYDRQIGANLRHGGQPSFEGAYLNFVLLSNSAVPEPTPDTYTLDFETASVNRLTFAVQVGKGMTYSGSGEASSYGVQISGKRIINNKVRAGNQARVISQDGNKVLTVVSQGTSTPNPLGGVLEFKPHAKFGAPSAGGNNGLVTVKSITIHNVTTSGVVVLCGNGSCGKPMKLERAAEQTLTFDEAAGVGTIRVRVNNAFSVDNVVLEVPAVVAINPCGSNANSRC